jgi:ectoine hydroxylase-related dioxygenase (phytanoyl-CoA dioxygenase family)
MSDARVAAIANDPRLAGLATEILGSPGVPFRATLFEKSEQANWLIAWHQDTALPVTSQFQKNGWGPWSVKAGLLYAHAPAWALARIVALRLHLDESNMDNGPLRVIPGSHRAGVLTDEAVLEYARCHAPKECLSPRGGVIAMKPLLIHSSSKARSMCSRRVLHIEYSDSLELKSDICLAVA